MAELNNPFVEIRLWAAEMLKHFGSQAASAVSFLIYALGDVDSHVRLMAIRALGSIGEPSRPAIPALISTWASDGDGWDWEEAEGPIQNILGRHTLRAGFCGCIA